MRGYSIIDRDRGITGKLVLLTGGGNKQNRVQVILSTLSITELDVLVHELIETFRSGGFMVNSLYEQSGIGNEKSMSSGNSARNKRKMPMSELRKRQAEERERKIGLIVESVDNGANTFGKLLERADLPSRDALNLYINLSLGENRIRVKEKIGPTRVFEVVEDNISYQKKDGEEND